MLGRGEISVASKRARSPLNMVFKRLLAKIIICFLVFVTLFAPCSTKAVSPQAKEFKTTISGDESTSLDPPWMSRSGELVFSRTGNQFQSQVK